MCIKRVAHNRVTVIKVSPTTPLSSPSRLYIDGNLRAQAPGQTPLPAGIWASDDPASVAQGSWALGSGTGGSAGVGVLGAAAGGDGSAWQGTMQVWRTRRRVV